MLTQQQILTATLNDIVFQDRNQTYGAYVLRNVYNHHLKIAIGVMLGLCLSAFVFYFNGSFSKSQKDLSIFKPGLDVNLKNAPIPEIPLPPLPPPPPPVVEQVFRTEVFTPPIITIDKNVSDEDLPPEHDVLEGARIGLQKSEGVDIGSVVAPPLEQRSVGNVITPKTAEIDYSSIFTKVENPAEFPGGAGEWSRYLQKNLRYPDKAIDNGTQDVVRVQFIVDKDGNISEVQALNDPGDGLAEEAVRIIKRGPKWKPAEQNGQKVIFRNIQAITFRLN
jgi:protein TonB